MKDKNIEEIIEVLKVEIHERKEYLKKICYSNIAMADIEGQIEGLNVALRHVKGE